MTRNGLALGAFACLALLLPASASAQSVVQIYGAKHSQSSALATSLVIANTAQRKLQSFAVNADSTLSAATWYLMIFDATADPGNGSVTPAKCFQVPSGTTQMGGTYDAGGVIFTNGIVFVVSSTGCFTETQGGSHAYISADWQ